MDKIKELLKSASEILQVFFWMAGDILGLASFAWLMAISFGGTKWLWPDHKTLYYLSIVIGFLGLSLSFYLINKSDKENGL